MEQETKIASCLSGFWGSALLLPVSENSYLHVYARNISLKSQRKSLLFCSREWNFYVIFSFGMP